MAQQKRPPVITIMGHVDHGKTSLLDYIRKTRVVAKEAGGITQHIGAYQVEYKNQLLTFIDTPGHAAFNKMRERGADVTDIVVLVVAANDGVKPQTIESIRHIKRANVPVVVAINKTDLKDVYPEMVKSQLVEHDIKVQGFGGDIDAIDISALTGKGVDKLLETLVVMTQLHEFKADPEAPLEAVVIESSKDAKKGVSATVIVQNGTLSVKQDIYTDSVSGRVKRLSDEKGASLSQVLPGCPAEIIGLNDVPAVGSIIRDSAATYPEVEKTEEVIEPEEVDPFASLNFDAMLEDKPKLKLIIKADVEGTLEAIIQTLDEDSVDLLDFGVGQVTEQDLEFAETSGARIIAFHTKVPKNILVLAKTAGVKIKQYDVIYQLIEDLQKQMLRLMEPGIDEVITGQAEIMAIFEMKGDRIAGVKVKTGEIKRHDLLHLKRGEEVVANPVIKTMKHGKEDVTVVKAKNEAGLTFKNRKLDFKVGDLLVAYTNSDE